MSSKFVYIEKKLESIYSLEIWYDLQAPLDYKHTCTHTLTEQIQQTNKLED